MATSCLISAGSSKRGGHVLLVALGADLWSVMKDADMETPLHMASRSGRLDIVQKLLRCGADHSKKTKVHVLLCLNVEEHRPHAFCFVSLHAQPDHAHAICHVSTM